MGDLPGSILFCCDYNAVRSPMAEGIMKQRFGQQVYVQSAGVKHDIEIDGFSIAVCEEVGIALTQHQARSFEEMEEWGDSFESYDLIVALSPAAQRHALEFTRHHSIEIEYWPIFDPTDLGQTRAEKLSAYRQTRDQIMNRITDRFGEPAEGEAEIGPDAL